MPILPKLLPPFARRMLFAICLATGFLPISVLAADPAKLAGESTVVFIELARPETLIEPALEPATRDLFKGVEAYRKYLESPEYAHVLMVKQVVEARLGVSWEAAVRDVLGG